MRIRNFARIRYFAVLSMLLCAMSALLCVMRASAVAQEETGDVQLLAPPSPEVVRTRMLQWAAQRVADQNVLEEIGKTWAFGDHSPRPGELFDAAIRTFAKVDADTNMLVEACDLQSAALTPPPAEVLDRAGVSAFYAANMRLFYGRFLAQRNMFEEALDALAGCEMSYVIDPATLLFYRAVCQHGLLMKKEGLKTVEHLLKRTEGVPVRYASVATLIEHDLKSMKADSLDEVSRKMKDVGRRLNRGHGGARTQKVEDEIVATLDEIIEKLEQQLSGGGGGGSGSGRSNQPSSPAADSRIKGTTGPGDVDPKKLKKGGNWGGLDDRMRARVKQLIGRDFPAHYRRAVEEYFRKAAKRAAPPSSR